LGFFPSTADPCLFVKYRKRDDPPAFIILYVDDGTVIGTQEVIDEVKSALMKEVSIKDLGQMTHFIGCHIIRDKNKKGILLHQPKLIKHLEEAFFAYIKTERIYLTPGAPKTVIMRPDPNDPMISKEMQTKYRSGVGMLLYLVKHSRPNLANAVRELSKVLDGATEAH
jgi:hypothetical protein